MTIISEQTISDKKHLVVDTGMTSRAFAQTRLPQVLGSKGMIFNPDGTVDGWMAEGNVCDESGPKEKMLIFGPAFPGISLLDTLAMANREMAWRQLHGALSAINRAFTAGLITTDDFSSIAGSGPEAILLAEDGRILVLPTELYIRCLGGHGEERNVQNRLLWIHPDYRTMNPTRAFAFLAGTVAYRIIAGFPPFSTDENAGSETVAHNMRAGFFEPLDLAVWAIRPAAAACINALITTEIATSIDTLLSFGPDYSEMLDSARIGETESAAFLASKKAGQKKRTARVNRDRFIRQNKGKFRITAIIVLFAGILLGTYMYDMSSKPSTKGLVPVEVVYRYYNAVGVLDQEIPPAFTTSKVKTAYTELITNLYVTTKVRQNYERDTGILTPAELFVTGLPGKKSVFGITGLIIKKESEERRAARFDVSFYLWIPLTDEQSGTEQGTGAKLSIYKYRETVTLTPKGNRWIISSIENKERTLVEGNAEHLLDMISSGTAQRLPFAPAAEDIAAAKKATHQ